MLPLREMPKVHDRQDPERQGTEEAEEAPHVQAFWQTYIKVLEATIEAGVTEVQLDRSYEIGKHTHGGGDE